MFLIIGFFATTVLSVVCAYVFNMYASVGVAVFYVIVLTILFYRNNKELQKL